MRRLQKLVVLTLWAAATAGFGETLTVERAVEIALANNLSLEAERVKIDAEDGLHRCQ